MKTDLLAFVSKNYQRALTDSILPPEAYMKIDGKQTKVHLSQDHYCTNIFQIITRKSKKTQRVKDYQLTKRMLSDSVPNINYAHNQATALKQMCDLMEVELKENYPETIESK